MREYKSSTHPKGIANPFIYNTPLINVYSPSLTSYIFYITGKDEEVIHEVINTKTKQLTLIVNNEGV